MLPVLGHAHFVEHLADSGGNGFCTTYVGGYDWSCCLRLHCVDLQPCERKHPLLHSGSSGSLQWAVRQREARRSLLAPVMASGLT